MRARVRRGAAGRTSGQVACGVERGSGFGQDGAVISLLFIEDDDAIRVALTLALGRFTVLPKEAFTCLVTPKLSKMGEPLL